MEERVKFGPKNEERVYSQIAVASFGPMKRCGMKTGEETSRTMRKRILCLSTGIASHLESGIISTMSTVFVQVLFVSIIPESCPDSTLKIHIL